MSNSSRMSLFKRSYRTSMTTYLVTNFHNQIFKIIYLSFIYSFFSLYVTQLVYYSIIAFLCIFIYVHVVRLVLSQKYKTKLECAHNLHGKTSWVSQNYQVIKYILTLMYHCLDNIHFLEIRISKEMPKITSRL